MTTYVTASGSRYEVDHEKGFWRKNSGSRERLHWIYGVDSEEAKRCRNWADVGNLPEKEVVPGVRLYIGSGDVWWLSTEIREVIEDGKD